MGGGNANVVAFSGTDSLGRYTAVASLGEVGYFSGAAPYDFGSNTFVFISSDLSPEKQGEALGKFAHGLSVVRQTIAAISLQNCGVRCNPDELGGEYLPAGVFIKPKKKGAVLTGREFAIRVYDGLFGESIPEIEPAGPYSSEQMRFGHDAETGLLYPLPLDLARHLVSYIPSRVLVASPFGVAVGTPDKDRFYAYDKGARLAGPVAFRSDISRDSAETAVRNYNELAEKYWPKIPIEEAAVAAAFAVNTLPLSSKEEGFDETTRLIRIRSTDSLEIL